MRWCTAITSLVLAATLAAGCRSERPEDEEEATHSQRLDDRGRVTLTPAERGALDLQIVTAERGTLTTSTLRFGRVVARPQEDALVVAPVTGRLTTPAVTLGASVAQGDVLVAIEPLVDSASRASLESERRQLWGQLEGAQAQVQAKQADLQRVSKLVTSGLATEADRAQAEATLRSEQARVDSLRRAGGELGRMTGGSLTLRAPVPGVVVTLATNAGALFPQGAVLARIVRAGPRWIDVAVPPGDPVGSSYRVQGVSMQSLASLLSRGSVIQPDGTRRDRLEAAPEAAPNLPPGATVPVEMLREIQGIIVPESAIVRRARDTLVFVEVEELRYAPRTVQIVARDGEHAALDSGVSQGERIVTRGAASLLGELGNVGTAGHEDRE